MLASTGGLGVVLLGGEPGTRARFSDTETDGDTLAAGTWAQHHAVFTQGGDLKSVREGIAVIDPGQAGVNVIGSTTLELGGNYAIPFHDATDGLQYVDHTGTASQLPTGSTTVDDQKSILATGSYDGSPTSVFYPDGNQSAIYRVAPGESGPTKVRDLGNGVGAVLGPADVDSDGTVELAFVDGSAAIRYIKPNDSTEYLVGGVGSNNNVAVGSPTEFSTYGVRFPIVNGSNDAALMDHQGNKETLTSSGPAKKTCVSGLDVDLDGAVECVFVHTDDELAYVDDIGGEERIETLTDDAGDPVTGIDGTRGVQ
jgi:hypothetical protein